MAAIALPLALTGLSGLTGLFGNKKKEESKSNFNRQGTSSMDNWNVPVFGPEQQTGIGIGLSKLINSANNPIDLAGYQAQGLRQFGEGSEIAKRLAMQRLAARGLSGSPIAAALAARIDSDRIGQQANFMNSLPLLQKQLGDESAMNLIRAVSSIPTGNRALGSSSTNESGSSTQVGTMKGSPWEGLFSGLGQGLAGTFGYDWQTGQLKKRQGGGFSGYNLNPDGTVE